MPVCFGKARCTNTTGTCVVQRGCTPSMPPSLRSISWSRFNPDSGGAGRIVDAHQGLGGPFTVTYWNPKLAPLKTPRRTAGTGSEVSTLSSVEQQPLRRA
jgi:hypothetical protein